MSERHTGRPCGAVVAPGARCPLPGIQPSGRCSRHGGLSLRGPAHPAYRHGGYAQAQLPAAAGNDAEGPSVGATDLDPQTRTILAIMESSVRSMARKRVRDMIAAEEAAAAKAEARAERRAIAAAAKAGEICGARVVPGMLCELRPLSNGRCELHGGKSLPPGEGHPRYRHGAHSKDPGPLSDEQLKALMAALAETEDRDPAAMLTELAGDVFGEGAEP